MSVPASESVLLLSLLSDSEAMCDGLWSGSEESLEKLDWERLLWHGLPALPEGLGDLEGGSSGVWGTTELTEGDGGGLVQVHSSGSSASIICTRCEGVELVK